MHSRLSRFYSCGLSLMVALLATSCAWLNTNNPPNDKGTPIITFQPNSAIDTVTTQVLANMHLHAWNPHAMTKGTVTGGLFINWKMDEPSITNDTSPGPDGNVQHDHDPQVDLLYLTALAEYSQIHPQDHMYATDLSHTTALVLADFQNYNLPKGWIYFYLLKNGILLHNAALVHAAYSAASNFYTHWYDPTPGFVYDRTHKPSDYNVDHTLNCGAALIDAGLRWHQQNWVSAGKKTIDHTLAVGFNQRYGLFYYSMIVSSTGQDTVENYKAKPTTEAQGVDALLTAYTLTHQRQYLNIADQVLQSMLVTSGLWDKQQGGLYTGFDLRQGAVITAYKETRDTSQVLIALLHYSQVTSQKFPQQVQELVNVLTDHFYQHIYHGFFYRTTPDFQIYVSKQGVEDYFTTEAMSITLDALQQTELI